MAPSTQVVFVRHAQTESIINNRIHGQTDAPLTQKGIRDAHKTADFLRNQSFGAFYSSPLGRAICTSEIIGSALKMDPEPMDGLMERYYGWLEGKPLKFFEPDLSGPFFMRPIIQLALKVSGESGESFVSRVINTFNQIAAKHKGERVLIVLHWGNLSILAQHLQGRDLSIWRGIGPWTSCGISEFHQNGGAWKLVHLNQSDHLI